MTQPQAEFLDLYRAGLRSAVSLMKTSLESAERLQNQQLAAIRTALDQQAKSVSELGQAKTLDELLALQTRMAGAQVERTIGYWSNLLEAARENQAAAIGQMQTQMVQTRDWLSESYAITARATEEAAKLAAAATANAGVRRTAAKQEQRKSA